MKVWLQESYDGELDELSTEEKQARFAKAVIALEEKLGLPGTMVKAHDGFVGDGEVRALREMSDALRDRYHSWAADLVTTVVDRVHKGDA